MKLIQAFFDILLQTTYMIGNYLLNTKIGQFMNRPLSVIFEPIIQYWRVIPDTPTPDRKHYFVSATRRMGIHGRGLYTSNAVIRMEEVYSIEIEELMRDRHKSEPFYVMGTRAELMTQVKGLTNGDFDNAGTMGHYRIVKLSQLADSTVAAMDYPQTAFRHWLQTQVDLGLITDIDGYVFKQRHPEAPPKNCEVGDFLYKYYDSFEAARLLDLHKSYYGVDALAKYLLGEILKVSFGVIPAFDFETINGTIRDRNITVASNTHSVVLKEDTVEVMSEIVEQEEIKHSRWTDSQDLKDLTLKLQ